MTKPIDPQSAMEQIWKLAPAYAKAKADRIYVEEYRKTVKAQLMKGCGLEAIGAQEREAYADERYTAHLDAIREAVQVEEELRWKLVAAQSAIEIWRSMEASNRMTDRAAQ
jgi:hypothetical protein